MELNPGRPFDRLGLHMLGGSLMDLLIQLIGQVEACFELHFVGGGGGGCSVFFLLHNEVFHLCKIIHI